MAWILISVLSSSQSPEKLRQRTEDLRRSNGLLEEHLAQAAAHDNAIESALESVDNQAEAEAAPAEDSDSERRKPREDLVDGAGIDSLLSRARSLRESMDKATAGFEGHAADLVRLPTVQPVNRSWPTVESYGNAFDLFTGQKWFQQGSVFATPVGTPVWATGAGTVVDVSNFPRWGLTVEVDHHNGFQTLYGHLQSASVRSGQSILRGQIVGLSGSSGRVTAPQTFYAVFYHRKALDPVTVLLPSPRPQPSFLDSNLFVAPPPQAPNKTGSAKG
jgi:murein DD-endopeptidase MepM/ murein hydrolase activator NlpD